ncbi:MAG TPA: hypothetical protein GX711_02915 [Clostridia bacterium]|nr:hypothetical protein [Clostridia bacterium]
MMKSRGVWQLACTYIGAVVGAGFASGQEIVYFFAIYGLPGLWGALLAGLGFAIFGGMVYQISRRYQVRVYHEFLQLILGKRLGKIADYWLMTYLFGSLVVMLAGCRAIFQQHLEVPGTIGLGASLLIVYGALSCREEGVIAINWLLVPVMIFGILLVTLGKGPLMGGETGFAYPVGESRFLGWALSSLLYVSYNLLGGLVVLVSINEASGRSSMGGPVLGGLGLGFLVFLITVFLQGHLGIIEGVELPLLFLARQSGLFLGALYALVLWFAMLTSAAVALLGLGTRFRHHSVLPENGLTMIILLLAAVFSALGFSSLVRTVYPFFGYLGLMILAGVLNRVWQER